MLMTLDYCYNVVYSTQTHINKLVLLTSHILMYTCLHTVKLIQTAVTVYPVAEAGPQTLAEPH